MIEWSEPRRLVREFHEAFDLPIDADPTERLRVLRAKLIIEEAREAAEELLSTGDWVLDPVVQRERLAKELADGVYVLYGAADALGIDLDEAVRRVHRSNMSKLGPDGRPMYREDGKVLKGPEYFEPDMAGVAVT